MNQHPPGLHQALVVRSTFEPSHLAGACTADAYEYVVPLVQRSLSQERPRLPEWFSMPTKRQVSPGGGSR